MGGGHWGRSFAVPWGNMGVCDSSSSSGGGVALVEDWVSAMEGWPGRGSWVSIFQLLPLIRRGFAGEFRCSPLLHEKITSDSVAHLWPFFVPLEAREGLFFPGALTGRLRPPMPSPSSLPGTRREFSPGAPFSPCPGDTLHDRYLWRSSPSCPPR